MEEIYFVLWNKDYDNVSKELLPSTLKLRVSPGQDRKWSSMINASLIVNTRGLDIQ